MDYIPLIIALIGVPIIYYFISKSTDESKFDARVQARKDKKPLLSDKTYRFWQKIFKSVPSFILFPMCYGWYSNDVGNPILLVGLLLMALYFLKLIWIDDNTKF